MGEIKSDFYIIIGKKNPLSEAKAKLVKYRLIKQKSISNENIFEFIDEEINLENAANLILECKSVLQNIIIILLPINNRTLSDGKTTNDEKFKEYLLGQTLKCYFYNEFLTLSNSK